MSAEMIYADPRNRAGLILIEIDALCVLRSYRQTESTHGEAGGILIGYRRGVHIHVMEATRPHASDRRGRYRFFRKANGHSKVAIDRWKSSGRILDYVGEWHTHPEINPTLSSLDQSEWSKILTRRKVATVFIVVGITSEWVGIGCDGRSVERVIVRRG